MTPSHYSSPMAPSHRFHLQTLIIQAWRTRTLSTCTCLFPMLKSHPHQPRPTRTSLPPQKTSLSSRPDQQYPTTIPNRLVTPSLVYLTVMEEAQWQNSVEVRYTRGCRAWSRIVSIPVCFSSGRSGLTRCRKGGLRGCVEGGFLEDG